MINIMPTFKKFLLFVSLLPVASGLLPVVVFATDCTSVPISGNYTVTSNCSFHSTVDGVDAGAGTTNTATLTINSGATLTISAGQTVVFGVNNGIGVTLRGTINIVQTGQLKKTALWMTDSDSDAYPSSTTQVAQATQPASSRRRNLMTTISASDCNDSDAAKYQNLTGYTDSDADGHGTGSNQNPCSGAALPSGYAADNTDCDDAHVWVYQNQNTDIDVDQDGYSVNNNGTSHCVGSSTTVSSRTYYKDTSGSFSWIDKVYMLGADCSDSDNTKYQNLTGYTDADGDTYGTTTPGTVCSGAALPSGYVSNNTDCNDGSSNVYQNVATTDTDVDQDGYYVGSQTTHCVGSSTTVSSRTYYKDTGGTYTWLSGGTSGDCYDSNANANPGDVAYFTSDRGDGSYDYNCNSATDYQHTSTYIDKSGWFGTSSFYQVLSGANSLLLVVVNDQINNTCTDQITNVTFQGVALTKMGYGCENATNAGDANGDYETSVWYKLYASNAGSGTISVTASSGDITTSAVSFGNVDQTFSPSINTNYSFTQTDSSGPINFITLASTSNGAVYSNLGWCKSGNCGGGIDVTSGSGLNWDHDLTHNIGSYDQVEAGTGSNVTPSFTLNNYTSEVEFALSLDNSSNSCLNGCR